MIIHGRVQGVNFRAGTVKKAQSLNIFGKVWNTNDGDVRVIAEGDSKQLDVFIRWCHQGPAGAHVTDCEVIKEKATGEFQTFTVSFETS